MIQKENLTKLNNKDLITLLTQVSNENNVNEMLERILKSRKPYIAYFYTFGMRSTSSDEQIHTNELIEIDKHFYNKLIKDSKSATYHRPISFPSNLLDVGLTIRSLLIKK